MSQAAQIRPEVLSDNCNRIVCSTLRLNIDSLMKSPVFARYERVKAKLNLVQCSDVGQLQRYQAGVLKERERREKDAGLSAHYESTATAPDQTDEEFRQQEMDECDLDDAA